ncbi:hypothetical protein JAAARDRAFT_36719 [Jaapia argillacea MUCL 33604]|uniref:Zinc finger Mcm10/DnaG-type domain-containing protein n=1 Tax=Jaapia argillacea MUCL 33604 TaxID=933084 RepID=A0A067PXG0_9AGAM|nr:hypothetical protein JAAARDRAFT_36719 [Jaapia argillacea MUCL 33604]
MDSSTNRKTEEQRKQDEIRKQIALLQAQLVDLPNSRSTPPKSPPKRKGSDSRLLAPATPSPKKRKLHHVHSQVPHFSAGNPSRNSGSFKSLAPPPGPRPSGSSGVAPVKLPPSNLLSKLAGVSGRRADPNEMDTVQRSLAFSQAPPQAPSTEAPVRASTLSSAFTHRALPRPEEPAHTTAPIRDDRLALIEDLEPGPYEHKAPFDDPHFESLEPNSTIRLSSRAIPHDDFQDYLRGRYYLSPSRLYSVIRLLPDKQAYDVPVAGDWVTIAVVAERGPIKFTKAPVALNEDGPGSTSQPGSGGGKPDPSKKGKGKQVEPPKPIGRKYVNLKLIDFGARSRSASSATGGKAVIRGDAFLSLLLFESDGFELLTPAEEEGSGQRPQKVYKGGSKGAFEAMSKLREGAVVALLNPKILKPFQRSNDTPHPVNNILAITPESASSVAVIGYAKDLGMCTVVKRDGKACGSWCDKRVSEVCDYHIQNAVERKRAGRAEFSVGTSGMSMSSAPKRKPGYDPARQWGLKPEPTTGGAGSTYVVSGHIISGSGVDTAGSLYVSENIGREGQARAARKVAGKDADKALDQLLKRDKEGMRAVLKAREFGLKKSTDGSNEKKKTKEGRNKRMGSTPPPGEESNSSTNPSRAYSAQVIKQLGFDPTAKGGQKRSEDSELQDKLKTLAALNSTRKEVELGSRPGKKIRSGVFAPKRDPPTSTLPNRESSDVKVDDGVGEDDDLEAEEVSVFGKAIAPSAKTNDAMIDLDSSDNE